MQNNTVDSALCSKSVLSDNPVYDQFLKYWKQVDQQATALRGNPNYDKYQGEVEALIQKVYTLRGNLPDIEKKDINQPLQKFIQDCKPTMDAIDENYNQALAIMNGGPGALQIEKDYKQAQTDIQNLANTISQNQKNLDDLTKQESALSETAIPSLKKAIEEKISDPDKKKKAEALLKTLISEDAKLKSDISSAKSAIAALNQDLSSLTAQDSPATKLLEDLQKLAEIKNPTQDQVDQANQDLSQLEKDPQYLKTASDVEAFAKDHVAPLNQDIQEIQDTIAQIKQLLPPAPDNRYEMYSDNWAIPDGHLPIPNLPDNVDIDYAFGEVAMSWSWNAEEHKWEVNQNDPNNGSWLANFPGGFPVDPKMIIGTLTNPMPAALAIGGWNASQDKPLFDPTDPKTHYPYQENNLFQIMTSPNQESREKFIDNIVDSVSKYSYKKVIMDYENYDHKGLEGDNYTNFLIELNNKLQNLSPPVKLEMAMSPSALNQDYYDIKKLVAQSNITFEVMCYDYAAGLSPKVVTPNAGTGQTLAYLKKMVDAGVPADRMKIGFSSYGEAFNLPPGTTLQDVLTGLDSKQGLKFDSYWSGDCPAGTPNGGNGQVSNDQIFQKIGNNPGNPWQPTAAGWQTIVYHDPNHPDSPPEVFYYNVTGGNNGSPVLISAQTSADVKGISSTTGKEETGPSSIDSLVKAVDTDPVLSKNLGWFGWDAMEDQNSVALKEVIAADQKYHESSPENLLRSMCLAHIAG